MEIKGICKRYRRAPYPVRRSIRLGFVCQIGLYLTAGLYALLAMPETRQPEKKTGGRWPVREANPFLSLVRLRHIEPWQTAVFWSILIAACGGWMFESAFNYSISAFFSFSPLFNGVLKCGVGILNALVGTGHALGIIPIGTGNLFARNMGVPVDDIDAALTVATSHGSRLVDMGRLTLLDHPEDDHGHAFLIIAGIGFDAAMIDDTNPELKANISWLAYFVGGVKNLFAPKFRGTLTVTSADGSTHTIKNLDFRTVMAGNCGQIPMFSLMPAASYDDGLLDFEIIDTTGGILGWANLFGDVVHQTIIGKPEQNPLSTNSTIEQVQGVSAEITLEKPAKAQVDGDMLPETKHIRFSVDHRALIVRVPDASALEKTAQAAASNATSDFAEMTGTLEPIR